jgi:hypothetical protein
MSGPHFPKIVWSTQKRIFLYDARPFERKDTLVAIRIRHFQVPETLLLQRGTRMMLAPVRLLLLLGVSYALLLSTKPVAAVGPRCPGSPNQCSLHGSCMLNRLGERVCNCQWGYAGDDCSKSK